MPRFKGIRETKRRRKKLGITQADLAFAINIDRSTMGKLETGKRRAKQSHLAKLSYALGFEIDDKCLICEKNKIGVKNCKAYEDKSDPITKNGECIGFETDIIKCGGD